MINIYQTVVNYSLAKALHRITYTHTHTHTGETSPRAFAIILTRALFYLSQRYFIFIYETNRATVGEFII